MIALAGIGAVALTALFCAAVVALAYVRAGLGLTVLAWKAAGLVAALILLTLASWALTSPALTWSN